MAKLCGEALVCLKVTGDSLLIPRRAQRLPNSATKNDLLIISNTTKNTFCISNILQFDDAIQFDQIWKKNHLSKFLFSSANLDRTGNQIFRYALFDTPG